VDDPFTPSTYHAFGMTIAARLPLPELLEREGEPEVEVVSGSVPSELPDAVRKGVRFQVAPGELWLQVDGVARYLARGGTEIVIDRAAGAPDDSVRLFLLGSVFAALLHQRGVLPLNASAVATERGSAVFMGLSGAGKSTLAAGFHKRGYRVLTDDLCAISFRAGQPMVWPAYPQLKLWPNLLKTLGVDPDPLRRVRPELEKRALPLGESFASEPLSPARLYLLRSSTRANGVEMQPVEGQGRIGTIGIHTYGSQFVEGLGSEAPYFENLAMLVAALPIKAITRPSRHFMLDELIDLIEEDVGS
jgi:hypothetical protein